MSTRGRDEDTDTQRIDNFVDAAFAFTVSLLVIAGSAMPRNLQQLLAAVAGVPAFAACFIQIGVFWLAHLRWRRRYGVADAATVRLSLLLVFFVLIFVYPLQMVFSSAFHYLSLGWLPSGWTVDRPADVRLLFICYGIVYACMSAVVALLYRHSAGHLPDARGGGARVHALSWVISTAVGVIVALVALALPGGNPGLWLMLPGFCFALLWLQNPRLERYRRRLGVDTDA